jgi:hypothetical protein
MDSIVKKQFDIKDTVYIAMGIGKLVQGRVVEIIDLAHLGENHSPDLELYIVEVKTGIDDIYEVRTWEQMSEDPRGPLNCYRNLNLVKENLFLKKVGLELPVPPSDPDREPTPEEIHAAMERSQQASQHAPLQTKKPKRHYVKRRTKKV